MPRLDTNFQFSKGRSVSRPVIPVPKNVKQMLCVDQIHENGIFRIEPMSDTAMYDQGYIFEDINYKNQDEGKKTSTLLEVMKWLRGMDSQFKITIANEQRDMDEFMKEIFQPIHGEEFPNLEEGLGTWISQKINEGVRDIRRTLYLTVTCHANSFEEAAVFFATLDTSLQATFSSLGSRLYRLSGMERLAVLQRMLRAGGQGILPGSLSPENDNWKNQILPTAVVQEKDYMIMDDKYVSVLFAHDFDQTMDEEKVIHGITDTVFPTYITLDIEPVRRGILKAKLMAVHTNNERAIAMEREKRNKMGQYGFGVSYQLDKKRTELEDMMDQVDANDEESVFLGMLVYVAADSLEELYKRVDTLMRIAVGNGYTLDAYYYRQLKALNTVLPIGGRQVNHMRSLLTSSAVAFQPFYAHDLQDEGRGSFVYGLNKTTKHLLRGDRKKLKAPHGMIVGHTGGGKSFLIKETEIAQSLLFTDDDVIILDPNNEQEEFIRRINGQYFDFTPQCNIYLNPYEVPDEVFYDTDVAHNQFVAKKTEYTVSFCEAAMTNIVMTQVYKTYIERAVRKMYNEYFAKSRPGKQPPTLKEVWENLKQQEEQEPSPEGKRMLRDIIDSLEGYVIGVYDMFAHPSNLDIQCRLVGFGLKNIPEAIWEPVMVTMMHFLGMRIEYNQDNMIACRLVVDEAQVLCAKGSSAKQLLYAVETYRKVGAVVTLAVQNLTRALENPELRDMFSNCPYKCFLDQGGVDAGNLASIQELSQIEFRALEETVAGNGVMVWGNQIYLFDALMDKGNVLYSEFNTDFHEKARDEGNRKQEIKL